MKQLKLLINYKKQLYDCTNYFILPFEFMCKTEKGSIVTSGVVYIFIKLMVVGLVVYNN